MKVLNLTSKYARAVYKRQGKREGNHILLLGNSPAEGIKTFLKECYHPDHGLTDTNVVIMRNSPPCEEFLLIMKTPTFSGRVIYLEGNPLNPLDLKRCLADKTSCVIVLANQFCSDPVLEDYRNILHSFAVKQYARAKNNKESRLCLQLLKPSHKDLYYSGLKNTARIDQVLCVEELKL
jgi:hypothetical protein